MDQQKKEVKIQIKGNDAVMGGTYANNFLVHMNRDEFVLDFINLIPPNATLNARVVMSPANIKRIWSVMGETLKRYEKEFGTIPEAPKKPLNDNIIQ
ncbi:MAG: DUF3467 domain-containing protein [Deltaproteobacteria bacterium]|nr:DUF3467 domain-containing protein [Deltaproteobacteria bacterium]